MRYQTPVGGLNFTMPKKAARMMMAVSGSKRPSLEFARSIFYSVWLSASARGREGGNRLLGRRRGSKTAPRATTLIFPVIMEAREILRFSWRAGCMRDYLAIKAGTSAKAPITAWGFPAVTCSVQSWICTDREINGFTPYGYDSYTSDKPLDFGVPACSRRRMMLSLAWTVDTKWPPEPSLLDLPLTTIPLCLDPLR